MQQLGNLAWAQPSSLPLLAVPAWRQFPWLVHGFSTRQGGISQGGQASLNLGKLPADQVAQVEHNRRLWARALGTQGWPAVWPGQVHGTEVAVATEATALPQTDGVVTNRPGLVLNILVADCLPILLVDPASRSVGAVHAGWRGTVGQIAAQAVLTMVNRLGARPEQMLACLGPGICGRCYRVDEPVLSRVRQLPVDWSTVVCASDTPGQQYLDLSGLNRLILLQAGLRPEHITQAELCTQEDPLHFYSHRRDQGNTGRLVATIAVIPQGNAGFMVNHREVVQQTSDGDEMIGS